MTTFSNTVSVQTQTVVPTPLGFMADPNSSLILAPQFVTNLDVISANLQGLNTSLSTTQAANPSTQQACTPCSSNGALLIDCSDGCFLFNVNVTEDINSITVNCPSCTINFDLPPNSNFNLCGFSSSFNDLTGNCASTPTPAPKRQRVTENKSAGDDSQPNNDACQNQDIRYPKSGCLDYILDCYDNDSYTPIKAKLNGSRNTGCVHGDQRRWAGWDNFVDFNPERISVKSGNLQKQSTDTPNPLAGFSVWFGNLSGQGNSTFPPGVDVFIQILKETVGYPIFGIAFNVLEGSTTNHFTGYALLFDYGNKKTNVVNYLNQNIRTSSPTILQQISGLPTDTLKFPITVGISNYAGIGSFSVNYNDDSGGFINNVFTGTGYAGAAPGTTTGAGYIWVGSQTLGLHSVEIGLETWQGGWTFAD